MPVGHARPVRGVTVVIDACTKPTLTQPLARSLQPLSLQHPFKLQVLAPFDGLQRALIAQVQWLDPFPVDGLIAPKLEPGAGLLTTLFTRAALGNGARRREHQPECQKH